MFFQYSLGIDIKDDKIAIAYLRTSFKKVVLAGHEIYALEKDKSLREKLESVREMVTEFMRENRMNGSTNIFVGIPTELTIFKDIEFPLAVKENLGSTLRYEMEKHIPLPADEVHFDYQMLSEDKRSNRLRVLLMVAKKTAIAPYLDFAMSFPHAASGTKRGRGISGIEPCSTALVNFFAYHSGPRWSGSDNEFLALLRKGEQNSVSEIPPDVSGTSIPSYELAPAFGLGLKGLWNAPAQMNLLPREFRKKPNKSGYYVMMFLMVMMILAGLAWGGSHILKQRLRLKALDTEMTRLVSEIKNIDRIQSSFQELEERLSYLNTLRLSHVSALDILRELSEIIPETAWTRELRFSEKGMQLEGYAESASELIPILEASPLFKDAVFLSTITKEKDGKERFRIGLKVN
ncbi:PilN domain-containing protein [Desulfonema magnum]|uniref:Pilus assembly domains-containing protein n=1 Tax=Desulfonema magnum TaxID=45655 RepID=A0A975GKG9_9BACT|nr:PilN domain-containing protein [Desulfonema magnum]QTA84510.1 Pilus assembly domains-containing protein [Desulfonema magnum]